jgi:hypothetical protein
VEIQPTFRLSVEIAGYSRFVKFHREPRSRYEIGAPLRSESAPEAGEA